VTPDDPQADQPAGETAHNQRTDDDPSRTSADRPKSRTKRFDAWLRNTPIVLILGLTAFLLTTVIAIGGSVTVAIHWYHKNHEWRQREYEKLADLRAGFTIEHFEAVLGEPVFRRSAVLVQPVFRGPPRRENVEESTFEGRDYWVQSVSDAGTRSVQLYAVTSCSRTFNPTFVLPDSTRITLNRTTLARIHLSAGLAALANYFAPGATANAHFIDYASGGNPWNYKSFAWGYNDACVNVPTWADYIPNTDWPFGGDERYFGRSAGGGPEIQAFRRRLPVNTYAETSPASGFDFFRNEGNENGNFQVGVDRILIRTVIAPSYPPVDTSTIRTMKRPPVAIRRAYGAAGLQPVWRCLHRRLPPSVLLFDKANFTEDPHQRPPTPIFTAAGGFIVVNGVVYRPDSFQAREVQAALGLEPTQTRASHAERALHRAFGSRAEQIGRFVVVWGAKTQHGQRRLVARCL
jgi:hypothetical protein